MYYKINKYNIIKHDFNVLSNLLNTKNAKNLIFIVTQKLYSAVWTPVVERQSLETF